MLSSLLPAVSVPHKVIESTESLTQDPDALLVQRAQGGDRKAFDLLVLKYQHKLLNVVNRLVHNLDDAEDVAQESFVRAYRAIGLFRGESLFFTWLYRIGVNTAKNHLSSRGRRPQTVDVDSDDEDNSLVEQLAVDDATPEREMIRQDVERTVLSVLDKLPTEMRQALVLREIEGLSYEDIAKALDCPIGTVRSRIFRARDAVEQALQTG
jgi:RNA polymerase sigma-70 factor, ECF subfamily